MFKKKLKDIDFLSRAGYVLYQNNKLAIVRHYNDSGRQNYFRDIKDCFSVLIVGALGIIIFPFYLIYTLFSFMPEIYFIEKDSE